MSGPLSTRPGFGTALQAPPPMPAGTGERLAELFERAERIPLVSHPPPLDLSPLRDGLFAVSEQLRLYRQEQTLLREALVEALLPWYRRLWRWIRTQVLS